MRESKIEKEINKYLLSIKAYIIKGNSASTVGTCDILACINGYFVAIEVKIPNKQPRLNQLKQIRKIQNAHGLAFYATNLEDVKRKLTQAGII